MISKQLFVLVTCIFQLVAAADADSIAKPNVILLYADDLGYGELGSYGQRQIATPNLDKLAGDGMRFTQFYAGNAVCGPSRASLLTGKHPGHASIRGNAGIGADDYWYRLGLRPSETTLGELFKRGGYATALFGKYHAEDPLDVSTWAHNRGFDQTLHFQWDKMDRRRFHNRIFVNGVENRRKEVYDTDRFDSLDEFLMHHALEFIDGCLKGQKPFFLMVSLKAPHTPMMDLRDDQIYADKGWSEQNRRYAGRITLQDTQVGKLMNFLEQNKLSENTLVLYTSDNGPHAEEGQDPRFFNSAGGLRGIKRDLYEGGIRVPLIAFWKGRIEPGSVSEHISAQWDFWPTFADLIGTPIPDEVDGISMLPELIGLPGQKQHDYLYWELQLDGWWQKLPDGGFRQALRMGKWKAVRYAVDAPVELYNLEEDASEQRNLAAYHPDIIARAEQIFRYGRTHTPSFPYGGKIQNYKAQDRCTVVDTTHAKVESPF
jgi:arylsulfatase A-like enzyme